MDPRQVAGKISSIVKLWNKRSSNTEFINNISWEGWKFLGSGKDKLAYYKDNLVLKIAFPDSIYHIQREWEQWVSAPDNVKKYLTTSYFLIENMLLFQQLVPRPKGPGRPPKKLFSSLEFYDTRNNYGRDRYGNIKFFDWVWRYTNPWARNPGLLLKEKLSI